MSQSSPTPNPPALMPVLSRGKHRNPTRGACFMEYTSLLAGEAFSDHPACTDPKLAAVLRHANDMLSDEERPALVPLLGRAIGLVVPPRSGRVRAALAGFLTGTRPESGGAGPTAGQLQAAAMEKFRAAVRVPAPTRATWYHEPTGIGETFWDVMGGPPTPRTTEEYTARLVQRLELLHRCYEEALAELSPAGAERATPDTPARSTPAREAAGPDVPSAPAR